MFSRSLRATAKRTPHISRRFNSHGHHHHDEPVKETEINLAKVFGVAILGGVTLMFYRNYKSGNEPVIKTKSYKDVEERGNKRAENFVKRYEESFIKGIIRDKGGVGQKQYKRMSEKSIATNLIPTHSPGGNQFGAGIKLSELGPRKERIDYFAPLKTN